MVQYAVRYVIWRIWWSFTSKCPYRLKFFVWRSSSTMCRRCLNNCGKRVFVCLKVSEHFSYVQNRFFFAIQYASFWYFIECRQGAFGYVPLRSLSGRPIKFLFSSRVTFSFGLHWSVKNLVKNIFDLFRKNNSKVSYRFEKKKN